MTDYCNVIDSQVVRGPCGLPARLRLPDGATRTDLAALSAEDLRALGWWPCVETRPPLAGPTEGYGQPTLTVDAAAGVVLAVYPVVTVPQPTLAALRSAALERYRGEAGECLRRSLPSPWDVLRAVATAEYQAWADAFCALVAEELARLEAAVAVAGSPEALDAIVADWPEVTP